jgi:hypothetical protein
MKSALVFTTVALVAGCLSSCTTTIPDLVSTEMSFELRREVYGIPMTARYTVGGKRSAKAPVLIDPVK